MNRDRYHTPKLPTPLPAGPYDLWDIDPSRDNRKEQAAIDAERQWKEASAALGEDELPEWLTDLLP